MDPSGHYAITNIYEHFRINGNLDYDPANGIIIDQYREDVEVLQKALIYYGWLEEFPRDFEGNLNYGYYTPETKSAVKKWQEYYEYTLAYEPEGIVGGDTWTKMELPLPGSPWFNYMLDPSWNPMEREGTLWAKKGTSLQQKPNVHVPSAKDDENDDLVITRLSNADFLKIVSGDIKYYGGDQAWFSRYTQQYGGCGTTAAANILAYMAISNPELAKLYDYDANNIIKADFANFMEEVYKYVTPNELYNADSVDNTYKVFGKEIPPSFGIPSLADFAKGVEEFAKSKGVNIKANWSNMNATFENAVAYIKEGLKKDSPVALINMFNSIDMKWTNPATNITKKVTYEQHWVTITGMIENKKTGEVTLEVSSWGGKATLSFNSLWNNMNWNETFFPSGAIYFESSK